MCRQWEQGLIVHCEQAQRCARVIIKAAARNKGDDSSGRNRIGRSMDDNASTDEPWWKVLFGMQKRRVRGLRAQPNLPGSSASAVHFAQELHALHAVA